VQNALEHFFHELQVQRMPLAGVLHLLVPEDEVQPNLTEGVPKVFARDWREWSFANTGGLVEGVGSVGVRA
jgi:hypothetical protein